MADCLWASSLTGGASGALDEIDGSTISEGDVCIVIIENEYSIYRLDADSGAAESSPDIISPDTNAGTKRWILTTPAYATWTDRGDPSSWDFTEADLTTDATWRDLDLSSIVPAGTTQVRMTVMMTDDAAGNILQFRKNGNSNEIAKQILRTQVANIPTGDDIEVACDSNRVIEYYASNTTFTSIYIAVTGWYAP